MSCDIPWKIVYQSRSDKRVAIVLIAYHVIIVNAGVFVWLQRLHDRNVARLSDLLCLHY